MENQHWTTTRKKTVKSWEEKTDAMEGSGELKKKERTPVDAPDHVQWGACSTIVCGVSSFNGCFLVANSIEAKERGEHPTHRCPKENTNHNRCRSNINMHYHCQLRLDAGLAK
jgi:hypothetical protein